MVEFYESSFVSTNFDVTKTISPFLPFSPSPRLPVSLSPLLLFMCSIFFAYKTHPQYRLVVAANRDEFYERPTARAGFWVDAQNILAGRDLSKGGTWLGVAKNGRFAAVTNYREMVYSQGKLSRGELVSDFLRSEIKAEDYLKSVKNKESQFAGFNLLVDDSETLSYFSNRESKIQNLNSGVYGLSNHLLNAPWRKVIKGKEALSEIVRQHISVENIFAFLEDKEKAADTDLPDTGIGIERERLLSSIFIESPVYGTRSSTVVLIGYDGKVTFVERTFRNGVFDGEEARFEFELEKQLVVVS